MISTIVIKTRAFEYQPIEDEWSDEEDWAWEWVEGTKEFSTIVRREWLKDIEKSKLRQTLEVVLVHRSSGEEKYELEDYYIVNGFDSGDGEPLYDIEERYTKMFGKHK